MACRSDFQAFAYAYPMFADIRTGLTAMDKRNRYKDFCTTHPEFGLPAEVRVNFVGGWRVAVG